jgi:hypothetical protein
MLMILKLPGKLLIIAGDRDDGYLILDTSMPDTRYLILDS